MRAARPAALAGQYAGRTRLARVVYGDRTPCRCGQESPSADSRQSARRLDCVAARSDVRGGLGEHLNGQRTAHIYVQPRPVKADVNAMPSPGLYSAGAHVSAKTGELQLGSSTT